MFRIKTKVAGRVVVATLLSVGLAASTAGIASASQRGHHSSRYQHDSTTQSQGSWAFGVVSTYVAGTSISILAKGSTTPMTYALTAATTITGLDAGATLASPDRVVLVLSATTPVTVTSIKVEAPRPTGAFGVVSTYVAGTSISILAKGSTTPMTYALTAATTITGLDAGATLASPDRVVLVLSATTPVTVTSIKVLPAQSGSNGRDCGHHSGGANHSFGGRGSFGRGNHSGGGSSWNGNFRR